MVDKTFFQAINCYYRANFIITLLSNYEIETAWFAGTYSAGDFCSRNASKE